MLDRLLDLLHKGGTRRLSDMARELGTTPELVEAMLEDLARMGYVKPVASQCSARCNACPLSGSCAAAGSDGRMWVLADGKTVT